MGSRIVSSASESSPCRPADGRAFGALALEALGRLGLRQSAEIGGVEVHEPWGAVALHRGQHTGQGGPAWWDRADSNRRPRV